MGTWEHAFHGVRLGLQAVAREAVVREGSPHTLPREGCF